MGRRFDPSNASHHGARFGAAGLLIIERLNKTLELKDHETMGHSSRVERHVGRMGAAMGINAVDLPDLRLAGALHDVGKVAMPDEILQKTSPLTAGEYEQMKEHVNFGAGMLSYVAGAAVVGAVRYHHERWDGEGYPIGLRGDAIPLFARIIAVADTYDAIRSPRPYRAASSMEIAFEILREMSGTQFDPVCVTSFLDTHDESFDENDVPSHRA